MIGLIESFLQFVNTVIEIVLLHQLSARVVWINIERGVGRTARLAPRKFPVRGPTTPKPPHSSLAFGPSYDLLTAPFLLVLSTSYRSGDGLLWLSIIPRTPRMTSQIHKVRHGHCSQC